MTRSYEFDDQDASWLLATMHKARRATLENASMYSLEVGQSVQRIVDVLEAGGKEVVVATEEPVPEVAVATTKKGKAPRKKRQPREVIPRQHQCTEHPHYGGQRAPRTDCAGCWAFYKHLQPTRFTISRRKFELNQRRKAAG